MFWGHFSSFETLKNSSISFSICSWTTQVSRCLSYSSWDFVHTKTLHNAHSLYGGTFHWRTEPFSDLDSSTARCRHQTELSCCESDAATNAAISPTKIELIYRTALVQRFLWREQALERLYGYCSARNESFTIWTDCSWTVSLARLDIGRLVALLWVNERYVRLFWRLTRYTAWLVSGQFVAPPETN